MVEAMAAQEGFKFVECLTGTRFVNLSRFFDNDEEVLILHRLQIHWKHRAEPGRGWLRGTFWV